MKQTNKTAERKPAERAVAVAPEYTVARAWPGVHNGQTVALRPDRAKRLLRGGFVEVRNA